MPVKPQGLPKSSRLLGSAEFDAVFKSGRRRSNRYFQVVFSANGTGGPRLGITVPKARIRRAHDRNRIKRLIRESYRRRQHDLPGLDIVVSANRIDPAVSGPELLLALNALFDIAADQAPARHK